MSSDPGSLQNLNPIVLPDPVSWWPPAPGWYVVVGALLLLAAWSVIRTVAHRRRNAYRRQALAELERIGSSGRAAEIGVLLKRTALSAFPRDRVANLTGARWHAFLDETAGRRLFTEDTGPLLDAASYGATDAEVTAEDRRRLLDASRAWIVSHRVGVD